LVVEIEPGEVEVDVAHARERPDEVDMALLVCGRRPGERQPVIRAGGDRVADRHDQQRFGGGRRAGRGRFGFVVAPARRDSHDEGDRRHSTEGSGHGAGLYRRSTRAARHDGLPTRPPSRR
jgi:hypothetical protein